ncbi:hypothetical protein [Microbacterium oxydans]|uniref:hypothetical protein n=1 Tax=Microbacterium oxydans TaxID=82380 RepID=UPI0022B1671A|nr:hypothetical protein [Microbacterium oxydans]MCZ4300762.1 hypothetical protein [Microbacterium oxydans]
MSDGIPVLIHLDAHTFRVIEASAKAKNIGMRQLIELALQRSIQHKPQERVAGHVSAAPRQNGERGYHRLNDADWAELKRLRGLGWTVGELATRYGCSSSSIYTRARREQ